MPSSFEQITLDNGLTILAEPDSAAHTAAVGFFVRTGCRDETPELMGVSHFLEHMMFKGTARRTADDVNREFDEIGANYNASTGQEVTTYWAHVVPSMLTRAIDLLCDMLRPSLRDADFEVERGVILEEIGMYADKPFWVAYEACSEAFYGDHPLGYRILGTPETIRAMTPDAMRAYFQRRYAPGNIVVSLAGRLDVDACVKQIEEACGPWPAQGADRDLAEIATAQRDLTLERESASMHYVVGQCAGPSEQSADREAVEVLTYVLGDSDGSRLHWRLIDPGLADEADVSHQGFDGTGSVMFYASCPPENAEQVESILFDALDHAADGLDEAEIQRAASKIAMGLTLRGERPAGRMMALGNRWLYTGNRLSLQEQIDRIRGVSIGDIRRVIDAYPFASRTVVRLTPATAHA